VHKDTACKVATQERHKSSSSHVSDLAKAVSLGQTLTQRCVMCMLVLSTQRRVAKVGG